MLAKNELLWSSEHLSFGAINPPGGADITGRHRHSREVCETLASR